MWMWRETAAHMHLYLQSLLQDHCKQRSAKDSTPLRCTSVRKGICPTVAKDRSAEVKAAEELCPQALAQRETQRL